MPQDARHNASYLTQAPASTARADGTEETMGWRGYFISLEGLDGAGKSTQVAALALALRRAGHEVLTVRPQDTQLGEMVRSYVLQHQDVVIDPWVEALLFNAGRVQLLNETIIPALEDGQVVIADRYADSTIAYQGGGRGLSVATLRQLHRDACQDIWPDLTFLLELPHESAVQRQRSQQLPFDRIESAPDGFHAMVAATFDEIANQEPNRVVRINAARTAVTISQDISEVALQRLKNRQPQAVGA